MPPGSAHERHDTLLVAQYAAADPLDEARQREAAALVASCPACSALAADLRTLAGAVAWEPVPPRRRDFRLSAEGAEQARGSRLQRFMRRLALPRARALQPVAAGVLSVGLLMLVAGNVWPDMGESPQAQPAFAPAGGASLDEVREPGLVGADGTVEGLLEDLGTEAQLRAVATDDSRVLETRNETAPGAVAEPEGLEPPAAADSDAARRLDEAPRPDTVGSAAGTSDTVAEGSGELSPDVGYFADDSAGDVPDVDEPSELQRAAKTTQEAPTSEVGDALESQLEVEGQSAVPPAERDRQSVDEEAGQRADAAGPLGENARLGGEEDERADQVPAISAESPGRQSLANEPLASEPLVVAGDADDGTSIETVLVVLGLVLAVAGLALLLLTWLARRSRDPLVP